METVINILLVDDQMYNLRRLIDELQNNGFSIDCAQATSVAVDKLIDNKYDLILLDLLLPLGSLHFSKEINDILEESEEFHRGLGILKFMRSDSFTTYCKKDYKHTPVIIISAASSEEIRKQIVDDDNVTLLNKPFMMDHLIRTINDKLT